MSVEVLKLDWHHLNIDSALFEAFTKNAFTEVYEAPT
jgi:hypothetical protein